MGKFDYKKWIIEHKYGIINEQQNPEPPWSSYTCYACLTSSLMDTFNYNIDIGPGPISGEAGWVTNNSTVNFPESGSCYLSDFPGMLGNIDQSVTMASCISVLMGDDAYLYSGSMTPTVDCPEGILYNTDCNNPDVISQVAGNTTDPYWINTCCTGSATGSCDNFASSIPTGITLVDFCIKCETNSWVNSGFEQYCECCPQSQPEKGPGKIPSRRMVRKLY